MDEPQPPHASLDSRLQALRNRAEKAQRSHRTSPTKEFLIHVLDTIDDLRRSLKVWVPEFSTELQTANHINIEDAVAGLSVSLDHSITSAHNRLDSRLRYRRLYLIGFLKYKRLRLERYLWGDLQNVRDKIDDLHTQKKILDRPTEEVGRSVKKSELPGSVTQRYDAFLGFFTRLQPDMTQDVRSSALQELWNHFPQCEYLHGKVGNAEDPGDGLLYDEDCIAKAKAVLVDLHKAWSIHLDCSTFPPPSLPGMTKICLILTGMQQQHLLEDFLEHQVLDEHLPIERPKVQEILRNGHTNYASLFYTEQRRVVPRQWDEGQHLELEEEEPLPVVIGRELNSGSYGAVKLVEDPISKAQYAAKLQRTSNEDRENEAARRHLEVETKRLKILRHIHVVHLVKSYRRGRAYGILLRPVAHSDLERLIVRYRENKFDTNRNCKHREWIRPVFENAFGCLSQGLAYIHGCDIRHKDVKPANILYIGKVGQDPQRLMWADFGLAHDFHETGDSKTKSNKVYSKRYAAPEIIALRTETSYNQGAKLPANLNRIRIIEDEAEMILDTPIESDFKEGGENGHGRKTDIFALGCVFLELLACLLEERLPMDKKVSRDPQGDPLSKANFSTEVRPFSEHITELQEWTQQRRSSAPTSDLAPLMDLAAKMIEPIPDDRPVIDEVVKSIARSGRKFFCETCLHDHEQITLPGGPTQPSRPDSPPSPTDSLPRRMFNRVNSASAIGVFQRVNSGLRPQVRGRPRGQSIG
ncbi:MAG: hypothetical protein L6R38_003492 [Xanthoria sp. 2 TBL-2021]|nr:MAG: hypothetical protein L6R38_003492 [Xanthoria sp. 2 TBL-2021]